MNNNENMKVITELQNDMNRCVNKDWKNAKYPWWRAAYQEATEAVEHVGWKWWKKQEPDLYQVQLELVDIFHFIVSDYMTVISSVDAHVRIAYDLDVVRTKYTLNPDTPVEALEELIKEIMIRKRLNSCNIMFLFYNAMTTVDLSLDDLFRMYIAKNALNRFRNANGYMSGAYAKMWKTENGTVEDNVVLEEIVQYVEYTNAREYFDTITHKLLIAYNPA